MKDIVFTLLFINKHYLSGKKVSTKTIIETLPWGAVSCLLFRTDYLGHLELGRVLFLQFLGHSWSSLAFSLGDEGRLKAAGLPPLHEKAQNGPKII